MQSRDLLTSSVQPGGSTWTRTLLPAKHLKTRAINLLQSLVTCCLAVRDLFRVLQLYSYSYIPWWSCLCLWIKESVQIYVHHVSTYGLWSKHHISSLWYTAWIALFDSLSEMFSNLLIIPLSESSTVPKPAWFGGNGWSKEEDNVLHFWKPFTSNSFFLPSTC